jgi:hypothetical protein
VLIGLVGVLRLKTQDSNPAGGFVGAVEAARPTIFLLNPVAAGIATIFIARVLVRSSLGDTSAIGAAWVPGRRHTIVKGLVIGLLLASCIYSIAQFCGDRFEYRQISPLGRMAASPGFWPLLYGAVVIFLGPFAEEILFRGVLYGGYCKSFGAYGAAALTTGLFSMLHMPRAYSTIFLFSLVVVSLAALAMRLWSGAVGPAIGLHVGYNAWLFSLALFRQYAA